MRVNRDERESEREREREKEIMSYRNDTHIHTNTHRIHKGEAITY